MPHDTEILIGESSVNTGPLPGQDSRAGEPFDMRPPAGCSRMVFRIVDAPNPGIVFNLAKDLSGDKDPTLLTGIHDGESYAIDHSPDKYTGVYFCEVHHAPRPFVVRVFAL